MGIRAGRFSTRIEKEATKVWEIKLPADPKIYENRNGKKKELITQIEAGAQIGIRMESVGTTDFRNRTFTIRSLQLSSRWSPERPCPYLFFVGPTR